MILAAVLVRPMRGSGVALALTLASAVNTALLLAFSRKNPNITVGRALRPVILYVAKLAVFSALAAIPILFLSPRLVSAFAGRGRIASFGIPFAINAVIFAATGILLLALTRDRQFTAIARLLRKRK
jgi:putative peptidoglycan lipid II flippase